jgi:hypothetical protein
MHRVSSAVARRVYRGFGHALVRRAGPPAAGEAGDPNDAREKVCPAIRIKLRIVPRHPSLAFSTASTSEPYREGAKGHRFGHNVLVMLR